MSTLLPQLNYFTYSLLIGAVSGLISAFLVISRSHKQRSNFAWFWLNIITAIWSGGYFMMIFTRNHEVALWSNWILHGAAIFIPAFFFFFVVSFLNETKKYKKLLWISFSISFFLFLLNPTRYFISDVIQKYKFAYVCDAGVLYIYFTINFFFWVIFALILLLLRTVKSEGLYRQQLKYIFLTSSFGFTGGASVFFLTFNIIIPPYPLILFSVYPLVITYAILRYKVLNIRKLIARSFLFFLLIAVITSVFAFTSFIVGQYIQQESKIGPLVIYFSVSLAVVLLLDPLKKYFAKITDDIFYKDKVDYSVVLRKISIIIAREIDLDILLNALRIALKTDLKIKTADILIKRNDQFSSMEAASPKSFSVDSQLVSFITQQKSFVITDELFQNLNNLPSTSPERPVYQNVVDELERQGIEFCAPVFLESDLKAIIILGQKQSGDIYGQDEIDFFESLAPQIAVAIEKSQLYESIGEFNLQLQNRISQATKKLQETNVELQEANAHLKQLDTAKSEFLSIASHQLRTPISAIKGYLSMLLEGDFGKVPDQQRKIIDNLFESAARLARLINIFLNVSRIESGRFKLDKTMADITKLVESVMDELKQQAALKGLAMSYKPRTQGKQYFVDSDKIREVILNLVDNAIKYTPKGWIKVETYEEGGQFHFLTSDSGVGIRKDDVSTLFKKFVRGTGIAQVNTQGSGLGLYIAQRVITEHGGKIWAESDGLEKGSRFHFIIPAISEPTPAQQPVTSATQSAPKEITSLTVTKQPVRTTLKNTKLE